MRSWQGNLAEYSKIAVLKYPLHLRLAFSRTPRSFGTNGLITYFWFFLRRTPFCLSATELLAPVDYQKLKCQCR
jgi:hypothetical protein